MQLHSSLKILKYSRGGDEAGMELQRVLDAHPRLRPAKRDTQMNESMSILVAFFDSQSAY